MESIDCSSGKIINVANGRKEKKRSRDVQTRSDGISSGNPEKKNPYGARNNAFSRNFFTNNCNSTMASTRGLEGPLALRDVTNLIVDEDRMGKCRGYRRKNEIARERWEMLAKTLLKPRKICPRTVKGKGISVRRFTSFDLIKPTHSENLGKKEGCWLEYSTGIFGRHYRIEIHLLEQKLTPKELVGFNNTGNICIWPSEEVLAFYLLSNLNAFDGKEMLEVGGGMTCLAGLLVAAHGKAKRVDLTDGNLVSVENVQKIVRKNSLDSDRVNCFPLDWANLGEPRRTYDVVLSSDCLFFDETRADLVEAIWGLLREDGVALVMAPKRGETLNSFVKIAGARGFDCVLRTHYEDTIWRRHLKFKESNPEYDENLHYPVLILLSKSGRGRILSSSILP